MSKKTLIVGTALAAVLALGMVGCNLPFVGSDPEPQDQQEQVVETEEVTEAEEAVDTEVEDTEIETEKEDTEATAAKK